MESEKYRQELIAKIISEKNVSGLSYQAIANLTAEIGESISSHTVWRALTQPKTAKIATLMTIAEAMGVSVDKNDTKLLAENHTLSAKIVLMEAQIREKDERIDGMKHLIDKHEEHIARQVYNMEKKDHRILILTVALCVMLAAAVLLLGFDILQPNTGYIGH